MAAVRKLCSSAVALSEGQIACRGSADQVISDYLGSLRGAADHSGSDHALIEAHVNNFSLPVVLESIRLLNKHRKPVSAVDVGEGIIIEMQYFARKELSNLAFGVSLTDGYGVELLRLSTQPISGFELPAIDGRGVLEVQIPHLNLAGGRYYLSFYASRPKIEILWKLENALPLDINASDYYGSGFNMESWAGFTVSPHHWNHSV
jgi:hypothetical protein